MPEGYLHLTCEQRCQIYALLQSGHSQAHIARQIGVDPSTISRELVRNTGARGYRFKQAHEKASQRRQEASDKPRKMTPDLVELIEEKLTQEQWSPDQISGRLAQVKIQRAPVFLVFPDMLIDALVTDQGDASIKMPNFFAYMLWVAIVLVPLFALLTLLPIPPVLK